MLGRIADLIGTKTAKHTFTLFFGSVLSKGIAFLVLFGLAHLLDRQAYEVFGLVLTLMWLTYEFTELGMNNSVVRHAANHAEAGRHDLAAGLFRLAGTVKVLLWLVVFAAGWLASGALAEAYLGGPGRKIYVILALIGGMGLGSVVFLNGIFYSYKRFARDVFVSLAQNVLKLSAVGLLAVLGRMTLDGAVVLYGLVPWGAFALGMWLVPRRARRWGRIDRADLSSIARFGAVYAVIVLMASLENRLGIFLLKTLSPHPGAVADYIPAQQLMMVFIFLLSAYVNVMFSKVSSVRDWGEVLRAQKKSILPLGVFAAGVLVVGAGMGVVVDLFLPAKYAGTVPAARWLYLSVIFSILGTPAVMGILYAKRLRVVLAGHGIALPLMTALCFLWIPRWGASGLGAAYAVAHGVYNLLLSVYFLLVLCRAEDPLPPAGERGVRDHSPEASPEEARR